MAGMEQDKVKWKQKVKGGKIWGYKGRWWCGKGRLGNSREGQ